MLTKKDSKKQNTVVLEVLVNQLCEAVSLEDSLKMVEFWKNHDMISEEVYKVLLNRIEKKYHD